jgi:hypothetical protein
MLVAIFDNQTGKAKRRAFGSIQDESLILAQNQRWRRA